MINTDRIVPVQATDLISLYGLIIKMSDQDGTYVPFSADDVEGNFTVTNGENTLIANEPVATVDVAAAVSEFEMYFVPAYDYAGFTLNGAAATIADGSDEVEPDGRTLYYAALASGSVTILKVGF